MYEVSLGAGEVNIDLRGDPQRSYSVQVRGGVGETVVYLPRDAGISATATKVSATSTVRLDVKGGVGEIRLVR